jgi:hypothetical protein
MGKEYIFIVGVHRSGTTLMRRTLNHSDQIAISDENHFLGHIIPSAGARYKFRKFGDLSNDDNVHQLVDYIYSGEFQKSSKHRFISFHWRWITKWIHKKDFLQRILDSDRSERALFIIMMQVFADHLGKPIMGEKTPIHFRYVPTLMEWFPDGKIIHMLRDPRAIFVSDLRRRKEAHITPPFKQLKRLDFLFKLYLVLQTTVIWFESIQRYYKYRRVYPNNYCLVKFEDLVNAPEKHTRRVCDFLGVEFQDKMLEQKVVSKGFQLGQPGFDAQAATRWKEHIDPWINDWFSFWFRKYLKEFGYADKHCSETL